jgi:FG-GAP repeat/Secretion system C-terminal sorting domain/FG-GAP-like repeat
MKKLILIWICFIDATVFIIRAQSNLDLNSKNGIDHLLNENKIIAGANFDFRLSENNITGHSEFGSSLATAGDLNGDGYDDIIVGAPKYGDEQGRVYIYFGGDLIDTIPDLILTEGDEQLLAFGASVANAGDVNGDGFSDVIVGAPYYNGKQGAAYIYYGGKSMDSIPDVILRGEAADSRFGESVASAGDVNNDGYSDIIIGADGYDNYNGRAYIYLGSAHPDNNADIIFNGAFKDFGISVATAGDVNNDGFSDIIIGGRSNAMVFFGGSTMDNIPDVILSDESSRYGYSVASAGDVNNDGYDDIIIGDYIYNNSIGRALIYYGGIYMDNIPDIILKGERPESDFGEFGRCVASAGDINKDGFSDVIIGAPGYSIYAGRSYVYFGSSTMDTIPSMKLYGKEINDWYGFSVSSAGDVNNDGFSDILIGSYYHRGGTGKVDIIYGKNPMTDFVDKILPGIPTDNEYAYSIAACDVNGDSYEDIIVGAPRYNNHTGRVYIYYGGNNMDNRPDVILDGENSRNATGDNNGDQFGYSVASAGDVNGDGFDDIIIGAYQADNQRGKAYIYAGGDPMDTIADIKLGFPQIVDWDYCWFGNSVASAGDMNHDGFSDVIVGAPRYNFAQGAAFIYYGGKSMDSIPDRILTGSSFGEEFGSSVSSAGDVNNDGFSDIIVGAIKYNDYNGKAYIFYGGTNTDSLELSGPYGEQHWFGASVSEVGDINKDGFDDIIVGAPGSIHDIGKAYIFYGGNPMDNSFDVSLRGESKDDRFGSSVASCGDINNDGYPDIIVGASQGYPETGKAFIYYGGNLMDNIPDVIFLGEGKNDHFGLSVASGNLNNDNIPDVLIGAFNYDKNGAAYIYFGNESLPTTINDIENSLQNNIQIFPIPTNSIINIFSDQTLGNLRITDLSNRCLYHITTSAKSIVIDISNFANGIYILSIDAINVAKVFKIIKL